MAQYVQLTRRRFLQASALAGGGLLFATYLPAATRGSKPESTEDDPFAPNAWIRIHPDSRIIIEVARSEMGQGIMTALPMLVAEELEVDLDQIRTEFAPVDKAYTNRLIGQQLTGGSTSIRDAWTKLREAGAAAREMLIGAAAEKWQVPSEDCEAQRGIVRHEASGHTLSYGDLSTAAAKQPIPPGVFLKEPEEFRLIGTRQARLDTPQKITGRARFGIDVHLPKQVIASVQRCPVFGGKALRWNGEAVKKLPGVLAVALVTHGIAVVARDTWTVFQARKALNVTWDFGGNEHVSTDTIRLGFEKRLKQPAKSVRLEGDPQTVLANSEKTVEAVYEVPFQAHACMEPMNCTADVRNDGCDIFVPTQAQTRAQQTTMRLTGLLETQVRIHTTFLGGGFGRRGEQDFVIDAVELSRDLKRPVQVVWTREDDIQHDFYRPATLNRLQGGLDSAGRLIAWHQHIAGPSIMSRVFPDAVKDDIDRTSIEGASNIAYAIPNIQVEYSLVNTPIPVGFWRSVGSSQNAFITECFLDELAKTAGKDPFELRRELLAKAPRHLGVLELAAEKADWERELPKGRYRGIAVAESFGSYVCQVAEVSIGIDKGIRVHRVVCAVDCGSVVNPDTIEAQMESGIVYGLTATLKSAVTIEHGAVAQSNFHDFALLRMDEMPAIEVYIVKSDASPGGIGEPGTPPIAPAVANAVFAATGVPVRTLPIRLT